MRISESKHDGYERVVSFSDDDFECHIAIHNTNLGPAIGGCRIRPYASTDDAIADVMRLAKGMTYKSSLAGLNFGGGKCVVVADKATREIMLKVGEAVNHFEGRYITAEDAGTHLDDILTVREVSEHTVQQDGSEMTARGVLACMQAALKHNGQWGERLDGVPVWVQGLGKVGMDLAKRIAGVIPERAHLNLMVSDLRADLIRTAEEFGGRIMTDAEKRFIAIYAPCAFGQVITAENVEKVNYSIICGSANNQLVDDEFADVLQKRDVLYVPDFLANAGGVISAAYEVGMDVDSEKLCEQHTDYLGTVLSTVLDIAKEESATPLKIAKQMAEERFA